MSELDERWAKVCAEGEEFRAAHQELGHSVWTHFRHLLDYDWHCFTCGAGKHPFETA